MRSKYLSASILALACWLFPFAVPAQTPPPPIAPGHARAMGHAQAVGDAQAPGEQMAATVIHSWPPGSSSIAGPGKWAPSKWAYEEGVLLDGLAAEWQVTHDNADLAYIQASVDKYVNEGGAGKPAGSIQGFKKDGHILDDIEMGRADLFLYRVTHQAKYAKAAEFLHAQLASQPRNASGGYWHKQTYPNQMWLDGAYMAEPFRADYAATFHTPADFDDIAHQLLLMDTHMRDAKTGLLRHGWDESKAMPWADKTTGLSPEVWGRAMGWYAMALVDVLDWFPNDIPHHPQHAALVAALRRNMAAVIRAQDPASGLWWQVMSHPGGPGNYFEASASCMFTYALAKGARQGYLPTADQAVARKAWDAINAKFITTDAGGDVTLHGTVSVGGLGGKPYRAGDYAYYLSEKVVDNDPKGLGAYMLAASQMEQATPAAAAHRNTPQPGQRRRAAGHINVTTYNPQPYDTTGGFTMATATIAEDFSGGLAGAGASRLILVTESATGTVRFTGIEKFTGKLGQASGSFLFENSGTLEGGALHSTWRIVPGSATGALQGLRGEGGCTPAGYQLNYWFE